MLRVDAAGRPVLPGTSIAGALRAVCERRYGPATANALFGYIAVNREREDRQSRGLVAGVPSRVTVLDAVGHWTGPSQLRHHVGLERATLTARRGILFDERVWPEGIRFDLRMECDPSDLPSIIGTIEDLLGPAGGVGSGPCPLRRVEETAVEVTAVAPIGSDTLAAATERWEDPAADPWPSHPLTAPAASDPTQPRSWFKLEVVFELTSPLAARVPVDIASGSKRDNLPFAIERVGPEGLERALGYPGSSLKGRLRQRAEYLFAHIGRPAPDPWGSSSVTVHPVQLAFGYAPGGRREQAHQGASGRIRCSDFYAARRPSANPTPFEKIEPVWSQSPPEAHPLALIRDRVAIDRLTGSTYTSAKFDDTLVVDGALLKGTITIVPHLGEVVDDLDLALVAAGLRDLATGMCGLGGSSHSGYGDVRLYGGTITYPNDKGTSTLALDPTEENPVGLPESIAERARQAWHRTRQEAMA